MHTATALKDKIFEIDILIRCMDILRRGVPKCKTNKVSRCERRKGKERSPGHVGLVSHHHSEPTELRAYSN